MVDESADTRPVGKLILSDTAETPSKFSLSAMDEGESNSKVGEHLLTVNAPVVPTPTAAQSSSQSRLFRPTASSN